MELWQFGPEMAKRGIRATRENTVRNFEYDLQLFLENYDLDETKKEQEQKTELMKQFGMKFFGFEMVHGLEWETDTESRLAQIGFIRIGKEMELEYSLRIYNETYILDLVEQDSKWNQRLNKEVKIKLMYADEKEKNEIYKLQMLEEYKRMLKKIGATQMIFEELPTWLLEKLKKEKNF